MRRQYKQATASRAFNDLQLACVFVYAGYNENRSGHNPPLQFQWSDGTSTSYDYMNWAHRQPHYSTNGHSNHMLGCAYLTKGVLTRRRRQQSSANHVYNHPGQWYASSQCSTIKKQYVCKVNKVSNSSLNNSFSYHISASF